MFITPQITIIYQTKIFHIVNIMGVSIKYSSKSRTFFKDLSPYKTSHPTLNNNCAVLTSLVLTVPMVILLMSQKKKKGPIASIILVNRTEMKLATGFNTQC